MPATANINSLYFKSVYQEVWRHMNPEGLTLAEADFIQDAGGLAKNANVLDLMCGYGRHALELAKRGIAVTAIDNLGSYIDEINEKAESNRLPLKGIQGDIIDFPLSETYNAAICMGNSFAFFNHEEAVRLLKKISGHLEPSGILIINTWMIAEIAIRYFKENEWHYAGDYKCIMENKFCFHPSRIESEHTILSKDGSVELLHAVDYIFTLNELEEMFREAGLRTKQLFSTPRKRKFSLGDTTIYIVAEKIK